MRNQENVRLADLHPDLLEVARMLADIELRRILQVLPESKPAKVRPVEWRRVGDWLVREGYPDPEVQLTPSEFQPLRPIAGLVDEQVDMGRSLLAGGHGALPTRQESSSG